MTNIISDLELSKEDRKEFDNVCDHLNNILSPENRHKLLQRKHLRNLNFQSSVQIIASTYEYKPPDYRLDADYIYAEIFFTFKGLRDRVNIEFGNRNQKI